MLIMAIIIALSAQNPAYIMDESLMLINIFAAMVLGSLVLYLVIKIFEKFIR